MRLGGIGNASAAPASSPVHSSNVSPSKVAVHSTSEPRSSRGPHPPASASERRHDGDDGGRVSWKAHRRARAGADPEIRRVSGHALRERVDLRRARHPFGVQRRERRPARRAEAHAERGARAELDRGAAAARSREVARGLRQQRGREADVGVGRDAPGRRAERARPRRRVRATDAAARRRCWCRRASSGERTGDEREPPGAGRDPQRRRRPARRRSEPSPASIGAGDLQTGTRRPDAAARLGERRRRRGRRRWWWRRQRSTPDRSSSRRTPPRRAARCAQSRASSRYSRTRPATTTWNGTPRSISSTAGAGVTRAQPRGEAFGRQQRRELRQHRVGPRAGARARDQRVQIGLRGVGARRRSEAAASGDEAGSSRHPFAHGRTISKPER